MRSPTPPRPVRQIVRDIQEGIGAPYGAEKLLELSRLLPGAAEVRAGEQGVPGAPHLMPPVPTGGAAACLLWQPLAAPRP